MLVLGCRDWQRDTLKVELARLNPGLRCVPPLGLPCNACDINELIAEARGDHAQHPIEWFWWRAVP